MLGPVCCLKHSPICQKWIRWSVLQVGVCTANFRLRSTAPWRIFSSMHCISLLFVGFWRRKTSNLRQIFFIHVLWWNCTKVHWGTWTCRSPVHLRQNFLWGINRRPWSRNSLANLGLLSKDAFCCFDAVASGEVRIFTQTFSPTTWKALPMKLLGGGQPARNLERSHRGSTLKSYQFSQRFQIKILHTKA